MHKTKFVSLILILAITIPYAAAGTNFSYQQPVQQTYNTQQNYQPVYAQNNTLQGNVIMVPAGSEIRVSLTAPLDSANAVTGQMVTMTLNTDYYYNNKLIIPSGSTVYGTVIEASKAKHAGLNGKLLVRFNKVLTPQGIQMPISAVIKTDDMSGRLVGGTKTDVAKEYTKDIAVGSAVGALSGLVFGSLASGDKLGRGVALGTAVGAGGGLAKSAWDMGKDIEIPAGASLDIVLTQPMTVSAQSFMFENR